MVLAHCGASAGVGVPRSLSPPASPLSHSPPRYIYYIARKEGDGRATPL